MKFDETFFICKVFTILQQEMFPLVSLLYTSSFVLFLSNGQSKTWPRVANLPDYTTSSLPPLLNLFESYILKERVLLKKRPLFRRARFLHLRFPVLFLSLEFSFLLSFLARKKYNRHFY